MENLQMILEKKLKNYKWEVYHVKKTVFKSRSKNLQVENHTIASEEGITITLEKDGKTGQSFTSLVNENSVLKAIDKAVDMLKVNTRKLITIPFKGKITGMGLYDKETVEASNRETKTKIPVEIEEKIRQKDRRIKNIRECSFSEEVFHVHIFDSEGGDLKEKGSIYTLIAFVVAQEGSSSQISWNFTQSRFLKDINPDFFVEQVVENAVSLLGARTLQTCNTPVLFPPDPFSQILETFYPAFTGEYLIHNKTVLSGKKGRKIASPLITLIDDGKLDRGIKTRSFDDEGSITEKTILIKKGLFNSFIHNRYTGEVSGEGTTGNGFRGSFMEAVEVKPTNFYIKPVGNLQLPDSYFKVINLLGLHTSNPTTGDFSVGVEGLMYIDGEAIPVSGMTLSGNFFKMIERVIGVGDDLEFFGGFGSPSILVDRLTLGGL